MEHLNQYLDQKIAEMKARIGSDPLSPEQEAETEAWFLADFFLKPVEEAFALGEPLGLPELKKMQQVIRGVYPYWLDNDRIYALGREKLALLSLIGRDFASQEELDLFLHPAVSVVMPTYNRAAVIERAIRSVLDQTYPYLELIVVDDGSGDNTGEVVRAIRDPRIRYVRINENHGTSHAKNIGISAARYGLIAFHDDDDLWRPEKLKKQVSLLLLAEKRAGFCYCEMVYHRLDGETLHYTPRREISAVRKSGFLYPELLRRNFIGGPTLLVRRECLDTVGFFNEALTVFEDYDLVLRLSKRYDAVFADEPLYDYFEHEKSLTTDTEETHRKAVEETLRLFESLTEQDRKAYGLAEEP